VPDIENVPKLIIDAFTGILYPDDNLNFVRGVQVEAEWGPDAAEQAEVWILGQPR
jgi:Holliday junction resolvase RusA-like endonuclease